MSQDTHETLAQQPAEMGRLHVRIPKEVDAAIERHIAGTDLTKQQIVERALRAYLKLDAADAA